MKSKLLFYFLPVLIVTVLFYGYSIQNDPRNDAAPTSSVETPINTVGQDTTPPAGFPYPTVFNFNYSTNAPENGGTVGAIYFGNKYYLNAWNSANLWRYNANGPGGGPGTVADSNTAYNAGTGAIRDLTIAPDGSGTKYLWGGSIGTALYKLDSLGNRLATYTHAGAGYRAIAWDPNRKGFWSCGFADNIVCRDTLGNIKATITGTTWAGKYGLGFDSTSSADSAFLWLWNQETSGLANSLIKIYIPTGAASRTYMFNLPGASIGIAGGAEVVVKDNMLLLLLNYQNYAVCGYKLKDLAPPAPSSITVCRTGIHKSIPENGGDTNPGIDTIIISGVPSGQFINRMTVKIDTVIHTYIGDLRFWLTKAGTTRTDTIINRPPNGAGTNSCNDFIGTNLVDTAVNSIQTISSTCIGTQSQTTGWFKPNKPLGVFNNIDPNGTYILKVSDNANIDTGYIKNWCITIEYSNTTGISNSVTIPNEYKLSQNYPNPFNPATRISYAIPKTGLVTLKVYNILGKVVATLVNEVKNAGNHEIEFSASNLASGVYFYKIESANFTDTKKMFLLK